MSDDLTAKLNKIVPRVNSPAFLRSSDGGSDIGFHLFDYPPERELTVREHLASVVTQLSRQNPPCRVSCVNIFEIVIGYLQSRRLLTPALQQGRTKGDKWVARAFAGPLAESKLARTFADTARLAEHDVVFMIGIGSAYPLVRTHTLLSNLHPLMGRTPLVIFYPGTYNGQHLNLFGMAGDKNYYRAFRLVP